MNGVFCIRKPKGMTSHDVVSAVRRICHTKRVGHTGTLDPDATGVLPVCIGTATRISDWICGTEKTYRARMMLGIATDTQDASGTPIFRSDRVPPQGEIEAAILSFLGESEQIPPMYSAIKKDGKKLYELARKGISVERAPRKINISDICIHEIIGAEAEFSVTCSKGTYIRTLCADIGEKLGCGAHMTALSRTACGKWFTLAESVTLEELSTLAENEKLSDVLLPTDYFFGDFPALYLNETQSVRVKNGVPIYTKENEGTTFRVYDQNRTFIALSRVTLNDEGRLTLKLIKGFYENENHA